ncbi:TonB-dependent receptor [Roseibacillus ishigakijimensis]|uniref:TonB-dependent siderophore receptor n=1 Tax=Roseibacillus ishigakijimensis TaxID=454146 RepID=A0A934RQQ6_9BACT|nr:TonB-dependent siderophore receptor [Roseibacillus ishigakijimensis]MBK1834147.1 TonB-dependent siderophore receptor [Roseibacillus ishigakijimensis]
MSTHKDKELPSSLRHASNRRTHQVMASSLAGAMLMAPGANGQETPVDLGASTVVSEEEAANDTLQPQQLSSPRYNQPLVEIPKTISVIPQELIKQQNADTIEDALRNVPGISLTAGEGGAPAGDQLYIRGFDARNDYLVDGIRDLGGYVRDSFNYEQVEVSKGPGSTDTGRGSTGGSVNLSTKTPHLEQGGSLSATIGTESYYRGTLDYNQPFAANSAFRLNLMGQDSDVPGRDHVENDRWGIAPSIAFGIDTDFEAVFSYMHLQQNNVPDFGLPWINSQWPEGVSSGNWYGLLFRDYDDTQTDIFTAEFTYHVHEDLTLRSISRYGRVDRESSHTSPRNRVAGETVRRNDVKARNQVNEVWATALDVNYSFDLFGMQHALVAGVDFTFEREDRNRLVESNSGAAPDTDLFDPNPHERYATNYTFNGETIGEVETFGIFLYDTIDLNSQWSLSGGVRYDHIESDYSGEVLSGRGAGAFDYSRTDNVWSWRGAINYKPTENGNIYFAVGSSIKPSIEGLSLNADSEDLDPEESISYELGTKWNLLDNRLTATAALFRTEKTNAISNDPFTGDPRLAGEHVVQGVELGLTGNITDQWSAYAGYAFMDSEITESLEVDEEGQALEDTPEHSFSVWTTYDVTEKLSLSAGARYVGTIENGAKEFGDYWTVDLGASYAFTDDITMQLNAYNVFDEEYIEKDGGGHFVPGQGPSATMSVSYQF